MHATGTPISAEISASTSAAVPANFAVASNEQLQRHDLMIELYRLDQAALAARGGGHSEALARIERARARVRDVLARLSA